MSRKLLVSLTKRNFEWDYVRGSGKGGQKKNKTSSAVRCRHPISGAIGYAQDTRSQSENRRLAFRRCCETKEFQNWIKLESARVSGDLVEIERKIENDINDSTKTKIETKDENGKWKIGLDE
jgi:protein subunit release factor B